MTKDDLVPIEPEFAYIKHSLDALNQSRYSEAIRLLDEGLRQHVDHSNPIDVPALVNHVSAFINYLEFRLEEDFGINREELLTQKQSDAEIRCSFCGKKQSEETKMIAGPTALICAECVRSCSDILAEG